MGIMNRNLLILRIVLGVAIVILAYLMYKSIMTPLHFERAVKQREAKVIARLIDIRNSQQMYKKLNNTYTGSFDSLITFLKTGEIPVVKIIPDPRDTTFTKTINDTLGYVKVADSLFSNRRNFPLDSLRYVPFTNGEKFSMSSGKVDRGGLKVSVYEVRVPYRQFLRGLDRQLIINLVKSKEDIERYPGLKLGSMEEPSTDGNWE
jgi:hypothetical protein